MSINLVSSIVNNERVTVIRIDHDFYGNDFNKSPYHSIVQVKCNKKTNIFL